MLPGRAHGPYVKGQVTAWSRWWPGVPNTGISTNPGYAILSWKLSRESLSGLAVACFDTRFRGSLWKRAAAPVWPGNFARWESSPGPAGELLREGHEEGGSPGSWGSRASRQLGLYAERIGHGSSTCFEVICERGTIETNCGLFVVTSYFCDVFVILYPYLCLFCEDFNPIIDHKYVASQGFLYAN